MVKPAAKVRPILLRALAIFIVATAAPARAEPDPGPLVRRISGPPVLNVVSADGNGRAVREDEILRNGDRVKTAEGTFARLVYVTGAQVLVGDRTEIVIGEETSSGGQRVPAIRLVSGSVRGIVESAGTMTRFRLLVRTLDLVLGVRGTDFIATIGADDPATSVYTISGLVEVAKGLGELREAKKAILGPGQTVTVGIRDKSVPEPRKFETTQVMAMFHSRHRGMKGLASQAREDLRSGELARRIERMRTGRAEPAPARKRGLPGGR